MLMTLRLASWLPTSLLSGVQLGRGCCLLLVYFLLNLNIVPRDVVIDLVGYRKFGHNEIDEPMFTQPIMYSIIKKHKNILELYSEKLIAEGVVTKEETKAVVDKYDKICEEAYKKAQEATVTLHKHWLDSPWSGFFEGKDPLKIGDTGVHEETLQHIGKR